MSTTEQVKPETALVTKDVSDIMKPAPQAGKLTRIAAFTPVNLTEAITLAKLIANSDLAPKDYQRKPANVLIAMQMGAELGVAPMQALQNIAVINGRASVWGDLALAIVQTHPAYEWHNEKIEGQGDAMMASCTIKRKGHDAYTQMFSVNDAKIAQLWNKVGPWKTSPKRMLQMRARGFALRDKFPDALRGLILAEEAIDITPDTSEAKKKREEATLDLGASVTDLQPSREQNRGHLDTGLERRPKDEQSQPPAKVEDWMCSECGGTNKHEESCSQFAKQQQDTKTSKPMRKEGFLVVSIEEKNKKNDKGRYLVVNVTDQGGRGGKLFCWHLSLREHLDAAVGKPVIFEISEKTKDDGKVFHQLEHIVEIAGITFVDDKPAQQATMPTRDEDGF